jgi:hypothetical protein
VVGGLERLASAGVRQAEISRALAPHYAKSGDYQRQVASLLVQLTSAQEMDQKKELLTLLAQTHERLNLAHFGGTLSSIPIRLSGRMRTRLGELAVDLRTGRPLEIAISRRHLVRHDWSEVEHTMLHEMVHQWQAESGHRVDHGPTFRRKAAEVGVLPSARRPVGVRQVEGGQYPGPL